MPVATTTQSSSGASSSAHAWKPETTSDESPNASSQLGSAGPNTAGSTGSQDANSSEPAPATVSKAGPPAAEAPIVVNFEAAAEPVDSIADTLGYDTLCPQTALTWPCGLHNLGNTCYANACLAALAAVPGLRSMFLQHASLNNCSTSAWERCVMCALASAITDMSSCSRPACVGPRTVLTRKQWCPSMANERQQDVSEFWTKLMQACSVVDTRSYERLTGEILDESALMTYTSSTWKACGVKSHTSTRCRNCSVVLHNYAYMATLNLQFPSKSQSLNLQQMLEHFSTTRLLKSTDDKCEGDHGCGARGCREQCTVVDTWPPVLCMLLARWIRKTYMPDVYIKENRAVDLPEVLPAFPGGPLETYLLRAAVIHSGDAGAGRYFCVHTNIENPSKEP